MSKPNAPCPCGSKIKYKKCCRSKGLFTKKKSGDLPSTWKNFGESDPLLRFAVGDRIELRIPIDSTGCSVFWTPGTIRLLNQIHNVTGRLCPYIGRMDRDDLVNPNERNHLVCIEFDTNHYVRPLGFTKTVSKLQTCKKCGVHESGKGVELSNCSGCRRTRYCSIECLHADRKNHKTMCRAIIKENERMSIETKQLIKTGKAEEVNKALVNAAEGGSIAIVKKLIKKRGKDLDINAVSKVRDCVGTALYAASMLGYDGIVTLLLKSEGIDINKPSDTGHSPLWMATQNHHVNVVKLLLAGEGVEVNTTSADGTSALSMASQKGYVEVVELFVGAKDIDINRQKKDGATPLYSASQEGHINIVKLLLNIEGIEINQPLNSGASPLFIASQQGYINIVKLLLNVKGIKINRSLKKNNWSPLFIASDRGHIGIVKLLLGAAGIEINKLDDKECTPLFCASQNGKVSTVDLLLNVEGIEVNQPNFDGVTPLTTACYQGHLNVVKLLLRHRNIDINQKDGNNDSALQIATTQKHKKIIRLLQKLGAV